MDYLTALGIVATIATVLAAFFGTKWNTIKSKAEKFEMDVSEVTVQIGDFLLMIAAWKMTPPTTSQISDATGAATKLFGSLKAIGPELEDLLNEVEKDFRDALDAALTQQKTETMTQRIAELENIVASLTATGNTTGNTTTSTVTVTTPILGGS